MPKLHSTTSWEPTTIHCVARATSATSATRQCCFPWSLTQQPLTWRPSPVRRAKWACQQTRRCLRPGCRLLSCVQCTGRQRPSSSVHGRRTHNALRAAQHELHATERGLHPTLSLWMETQPLALSQIHLCSMTARTMLFMRWMCTAWVLWHWMASTRFKNFYWLAHRSQGKRNLKHTFKRETCSSKMEEARPCTTEVYDYYLVRKTDRSHFGWMILDLEGLDSTLHLRLYDLVQ